MPKGSVLKLTGLGGDITREDIKEVNCAIFLREKYLHGLGLQVLKDQCSVNIDKDGGDIAFITYEKGEAEAKVRMLRM